MSKETKKFPRPTRILSKKNLEISWKSSRDSTPKCGAPGTDGVRAKTYAAKLDSRLSELTKRIKLGQYGFSSLRPNPIPKPGDKNDRVICVPTIEDRLVQRTIARYLQDRKLFPIYNDVSFGFIPEIGTKMALSKVLELRREFDYVFETDISAFFDNIDRSLLVQKVRTTLGRHSLVPFLINVIKTEIRETPECNRAKLESLGIFSGKGLRQGMPLSPLLANLALAEFDSAIQSRRLKMVRYADDIVVFASSKKEIREASRFVIEKLKEFGHSIPEESIGGKTKFATKHNPIQFLGREIKFLDREGDYVQGIHQSQIDKIKSRMLEFADLEALLAANLTFPEVAGKINQKAASYIASYSDAYNATHLDNEMKQVCTNALKNIYSKIFGKAALNKVSKKHFIFLGLKSSSPYIDDIDYQY